MKVDELALFGGTKAFAIPRSTSNLIQPDLERFWSYLEPDLLRGNLSSDAQVVQLFEERLSQWHQSKHCISMVNGLWALVLAIDTLKLPGKTEIIMPSMTYRRMADIAAWLKMVPHFCDVEPETAAMSVSAAESCINANTALLLVPHPIVHLADVNGMLALGEKYGIPVLFDSVESVYAEYKGKPTGAWGTEVFSMHASKFLNGFEGGYITTQDDAINQKLHIAKNQGVDRIGNRISPGMNAHLPAPHAAMTLASLDDVPRQVEKNKQIFLAYLNQLQHFEGARLVEYSSSERRSFKNIIIELCGNWLISRDQLLTILQKENMVVRPNYFPPLHLKKSVYPTITGDMTNTNVLMNTRVLMPCGDFMEVEDVTVVVDYLKFIYENQQEILGRLANLNG
jgi:dTDP-4-amino-4,6-dideoxygalactose transaminase